MPYKMKKKHISLAAGLTVLLMLGIFVFVLGNMKDLLLGSSLTIDIAPDGTTLSDGFLPLSGKARHARAVLVNGRTLFIDRDGNFSDGIILSPGYNVVEFALRNQFGKQTTRTYHLVLDQSSTVASVRALPERY